MCSFRAYVTKTVSPWKKSMIAVLLWLPHNFVTSSKGQGGGKSRPSYRTLKQPAVMESSANV